MKIDKRLNLTFTVDGAEEGSVVHIHSVPISMPVFEKYYLPISKVISAIYSEGLGLIGGPRVASLMLRQVADNLGIWEGKEGVERGLVAEIRRLTNAVVMNNGAWDVMPIEDALKAGLISEDDFREAESQVTFFTFSSVVHKRKNLPEMLKQFCDLWELQISSLNVTEYKDSLPISTAAVTSEPTQVLTPLSSIPH